MYDELLSAGLYHGRTRTSTAVLPVAFISCAAMDAAPIAAEDASGSAASTIICAWARWPRLRLCAKSGGMITAARTVPP